MAKIAKLKKEFLEYLEIEKGRAVKTVENYDRYLKRFFDFAKISAPEDIAEDIVRRYRLYLNRADLDKPTQNYYVIALRMFLKYLSKRDVKSLDAEKIELAKLPQRELDLLSAEDLERLLKAPDGSSAKVLRDRAILEMFFSTGLRISELCALKIDDINIKRGEFSVRGTGGKVRVVFLSDRAKKAILAYLEKRSDVDEKKLFPITPPSIQRIL